MNIHKKILVAAAKKLSYCQGFHVGMCWAVWDDIEFRTVCTSVSSLLITQLDLAFNDTNSNCYWGNLSRWSDRRYSDGQQHHRVLALLLLAELNPEEIPKP